MVLMVKVPLLHSLLKAESWLLEPQIPNNASSPNISRIFGTNTSAFELLVLKRKIMGPCWLQVKKPLIDNKAAAYSDEFDSALHHESQGE